MKAILNIVTASLIIVAFIYSIVQKQTLIANGEVIYLKLAPVDPRSIMQGDYMRLRYEIENSATMKRGMPRTGLAYLKLDEKRIVTAANYFTGSLTIAEDEIKFKFGSNGNQVKIQPDSFLFQQGLRTTYAEAKYGIFKVSAGEHLLVGLADENLKEIKPPNPDVKTN